MLSRRELLTGVISKPYKQADLTLTGTVRKAAYMHQSVGAPPHPSTNVNRRLGSCRGSRRSPAVHIGGRVWRSSNRLMHVRRFAAVYCPNHNVQTALHAIGEQTNQDHLNALQLFAQTATRALDGRNIKAEPVVCLESTAHVEVSIAASKAT
jgi:hypothetical protein